MTQVRVYWNLHRDCYSVQVRKRNGAGHLRWIVSHYTNEVRLRDCTFTVSAAGQARVRREQCKNVHAYICGTLTDDIGDDGDSVRYDPYTMDGFEVDGDVVRHADLVHATMVDARPKVFAVGAR